MRRPRPNGITVTALMLTNGFGIISAGTRFPWANLKPIPWKATMRNCDIIWHAWLANRVAFLAALMPWNVLCACSFTVSTVGSYKQQYPNYPANVMDFLSPLL